MIGAELASTMGVDLGFSTLEDVWAEVTSLSPLHQGIGGEVLAGLSAHDGVVVPLVSGAAERTRPRPLDPMADPGIASAEMHTVAPTALGSTRQEVRQPEVPGLDGELPPLMGLMPASGGGPLVPEPADAPQPGDRAPLRLVARRTMWDGGTQGRRRATSRTSHPPRCCG